MSSKSFTWGYSIHDCEVAGAFIELKILNTGKPGLISRAMFMLDSGSDFNFIKKEVFEMLDLDFSGDENFTIGDRPNQNRKKCFLGIEISQLNYEEDLEAAIWETYDVGENILGRTFLNNFLIYLDGKKQEFTLHR